MKLSQTRDRGHSDCSSGIYVAVNRKWEVCSASILLHRAYKGQVFNIVNLLQGVFPMHFTKYEWISLVDTENIKCSSRCAAERSMVSGTQVLQEISSESSLFFQRKKSSLCYFKMLSPLKFTTRDRFSVAELRLDHSTSGCSLQNHH